MTEMIDSTLDKYDKHSFLAVVDDIEIRASE